MADDNQRAVVSLLVKSDGANGSTIFTDDSIYAHTITTSGSSAISTEQSKFGGSSYKGIASGNRLTIPIHFSLQLLDYDWTVECWVYLTGLPSAQQRIFGWKIGAGITTGELRINADNTLRFYQDNNGSMITDVNHPALSINTWEHVSISRVNGIVTMHINGDSSSVTTVTNLTTAYNTIDSDIEIGGSVDTSAESLIGFIDDLRFSIGAARYTPEFRPLEVEFSDTDAVDSQLLLHFNGLDGSTTFIDSGVNTVAVTANGDAQIDTAESKFGGASGLFDGTGDYLSAVFSSDWQLEGVSDFTLEASIHITTIGTRNVVASNKPTGSTEGWSFYIEATTGVLTWEYYGGSLTSGVTQLNTNEWYHIAVSKDSVNGLLLFLNGRVEVTEISPTLGTASTDILQIGAEDTGTTGELSGHIDELRLTNGTARYTSEFNVPTEEFSIIAPANSCSLLLHCDGTDGGTDIIDDGVYGYTVTASGNAHIEADQFKFGDASIYFDGTGDYISTPMNPSLDISEADWTIEFFMRVDLLDGASRIIFTIRDVSKPAKGFSLFISGATNKLKLLIGDANAASWDVDIDASTALVVNTWYHIAITRETDTIRLFQEGALAGSAAFSAAIATQSHPVVIGINSDLTGNGYQGYIDELRITKGLSRYNAAFTAPTSAFVNPLARLITFIGDGVITFVSGSVFGVIRKIYSLTGNGIINIRSISVMYAFALLVKPQIVGTVYTCIATGAADGLSDLEIPISTISQSLKQNGTSGVTVVCPSGLEFSDGITARSNGGIVVTSTELYSDGTKSISSTDEFSIAFLQSSRGARNFSVTINGTKTFDLGAAKKHVLQNQSFQSTNQQGKRTVRSGYDKDVLPNDTMVLSDNSEFKIDNISVFISKTQTFMSLTEQ